MQSSNGKINCQKRSVDTHPTEDKFGNANIEMGDANTQSCRQFSSALVKDQLENRSLICVMPSLNGGGAERVITILANGFAAAGKSIYMALTKTNTISYSLDQRIEVINNHEKNSVLGQILFIRRIAKKDPNAVFLSFLTYQNLYTIIALTGLSNRIIVSERNNPYYTVKGKWMNMIRNVLYNKADYLVFQTEEAREYFPKKIYNKSAIILNLLKDDLPQPYNGCREKKFVAISRLNRQKNIPVMLQACQLVFRKHPEYCLELYGEGSEKETLQQYAYSLGIQEKVFFMGFVKDVHRQVIHATAFLSSSDYEGISNSIQEAMAIGLPCICTDCPVGGTKMLIQNNNNGFLVPIGGAEQMATAMNQVIEEPGKAEEISRQAAKISVRLNTESILAQWERIIWSKHE